MSPDRIGHQSRVLLCFMHGCIFIVIKPSFSSPGMFQTQHLFISRRSCGSFGDYRKWVVTKRPTKSDCYRLDNKRRCLGINSLPIQGGDGCGRYSWKTEGRTRSVQLWGRQDRPSKMLNRGAFGEKRSPDIRMQVVR